MSDERIQEILPGFETMFSNKGFETRDVERDYIEEHFSRPRRIIEEEYPEVVRLAEAIFDRVHTPESYSKLARGLMYIGMMEKGWRLRALATVGMDMALEKRVSMWPTLLDVMVPSHATQVNMNELGLIPRSGKPLAFLHGHYRSLTPGGLSTVIVAGENTDLLMGIESEERTRQHKTEKIIYSGKDRKEAFLTAGLCEYLFEIKDIPYNDEGYRGLLNLIKPDIYYSNRSYPVEVRQERMERARLVGAKYVELDPGPGQSTTELLTHGELRDYESEFLSLPFVHMPRWDGN